MSKNTAFMDDDEFMLVPDDQMPAEPESRKHLHNIEEEPENSEDKEVKKIITIN